MNIKCEELLECTPDIATPSSSNWMQYLNCARNKQEENLITFKHRGSLFYRYVGVIFILDPQCNNSS